MKNLKSLVIAGMIGAGSLGIFGNNGYGQESDAVKYMNNAYKRGAILNYAVSVLDSMIPEYNICVRNEVKDTKNECAKIFLAKLTKSDSLLREFKSIYVKHDFYFFKVDESTFMNSEENHASVGWSAEFIIASLTNESIDSLIGTNKKLYNTTEFFINNPSQKNYNDWKNRVETYKKDFEVILVQSRKSN